MLVHPAMGGLAEVREIPRFVRPALGPADDVVQMLGAVRAGRARHRVTLAHAAGAFSDERLHDLPIPKLSSRFAPLARYEPRAPQGRAAGQRRPSHAAIPGPVLANRISSVRPAKSD